MADRDQIIKNKVAPKDLGSAKIVSPEDGPKRVVLGTIVGRANKVKHGTANDGRPYIGLYGSFAAVPADASKPIYRSGVCYLPPAIAETIALMFEDATGEVLEDAPENVDFGYEIAAVKADNPIGYSYECRSLIKPAESDPLEGMLDTVARLPKPTQAALGSAKK